MNGTPKRFGKCSTTRLGVPSKLVRFPNAQRRAGRPRSSPPSLTRLVRYNKNATARHRLPTLRYLYNVSRPFGDEGKPRPYITITNANLRCLKIKNYLQTHN
ncbi:MAG: hypothetical protein LBQ66_04295 [Planctomycetaceae bacterium]|nr:hypothetical protein [Planctomycetaceae bacterium]